MKRLTCLAISTILILSLVSCSQQNADGNTTTGTAAGQSSGFNTSSTSSPTSETSTISDSQPVRTSDSTTTVAAEGDRELLQSMSADLDGDGREETIQVYKLTLKSTDSGTNELEGHLKITGGNQSRDVVFIRKPEGVTGVMSSVDIRDLDGDGGKDLVVVIPDAGAAFNLNYFFLYSYKRDLSYTYNSDSDLVSFANSFTFKYLGKGELEISKADIGFTAKINIVSKNRGTTADDENNTVYEGSWVEPVPVVINDSSKLEIVKASDGKPEIKVPLPIFGQATSDIIGEVDLYYRVDEQFKVSIDRFDVLDYSDTGSVKIGSALINR